MQRDKHWLFCLHLIWGALININYCPASKKQGDLIISHIVYVCVQVSKAYPSALVSGSYQFEVRVRVGARERGWKERRQNGVVGDGVLRLGPRVGDPHHLLQVLPPQHHGSACLVLRERGRGGRVARVVQRLVMLLLWQHRHALVGDPRPEPRLVRLITHNLDPAVRQLDLVLPLGELARRVLHVAVVVTCPHQTDVTDQPYSTSFMG